MGELVNLNEFRNRPGRRHKVSDLPLIPGAADVTEIPSSGAYIPDEAIQAIGEAMGFLAKSRMTDEEFSRAMGVTEVIPFSEYYGIEDFGVE